MSDEIDLRLFDHYQLWSTKSSDVGKVVGLQGQFNDGAFTASLDRFEYIGNPVSKTTDMTKGAILQQGHHLTGYVLDPAIPTPPKWVRFTNQLQEYVRWNLFNEVAVDGTEKTRRPLLLVPACKSLKTYPQGEPPTRNHYLCYPAVGEVFYARETKHKQVTLVDQFKKKMIIVELEPMYFCVPVTKTRKGQIHPIVDEKLHLAIYRFAGGATFEPTVYTLDQFGPRAFEKCTADMLAVPSEKIAYWPMEEA